MDYQRIYSEFIANRKSKPTPAGYTESHHIVPRSLGGGDEPDNLIRLTAEDHFFAHLLLAKVHGGKMWAPIAFMIGGQKREWRPCKSRRSYAWAMNAMANSKRGEGAHQFDHTTYKLTNVGGGAWSGLQSDMTILGLSKSLANMLVKGRVKSARGWFLEGHRPRERGGKSHAMADHRLHHFCHVDGRKFVGTQIEFQGFSGISQSGCTALVTGNRTISKGWYIEGTTPKRAGRAGAYF